MWRKETTNIDIR